MEHNKKEWSLNPSEKRMRAWLENSPACTKIVDLDFNLQYMSNAGVKYLHIDNVTLLYGKPYPFDFYPESFRDVMTKNMEKVVETGVVVAQEASVVDTEGNELWFHSTIIPVNNDEDLIDHLMIVSIDTTSSKKAERGLIAVNENLEKRVEDRTVELNKANEELQKKIVKSKQAEELAKSAKERLQLSLHSTHAGTWDWNIETGVVKWDKSMQEIFGIEYGTYKGTYDEWKMLVHPDDRKEADKATKNSIETGEQYYAEYRVKAVGDSWRYIRAQAIVKYDISDKPIRMVGVVIDITESKRMEQALIQSEKLKSMATITAGISHEFNNILNIISGNVQLLQMNHQDNKELMDRFCTIMESVDDGVNITDRMREFTHSDRDAANVDFVCSDINELIIQSVKFTMPRWKTMAQVESIDYQIDTGSINGVSPILCDPTGIREVFINIINNALDAMPEGGKIAFCTRNNEGNVFISISDTGKGMTEEVRKEVFDPFFTTRRPMGTGLGLSMAYKTVMMHGGRIEVESEVGKGSTFTLQFPLTTKTVDVPSKEKIPEPLTKDLSLNILVVDDEEAICKIMDSVLSEQGHKVKTVNNGTEAIDLSKNEHFDLVLCDLVMPKVSGYEVVKALHKLKKVPKIGIITGWGDLNFTEEDGKRVDFIIRKPFDFSVLSKHINDVIATA